MAKTKHGNKQYYISIILLSLIIGIITINIKFMTQKQQQSNVINNENPEIISLNQNITDINNEILKVEQELKQLENIEEEIKEEQNNLYKNAKKLEDLILENKVNKKIAYLTFDDGPYNNTYKVLEILKNNNVKATFFTTNLNGDYCYDNKTTNCHNLYKEYLKEGHTLANHTYTHAIWRGLYNSTESFMTAVINQENMINKITDGYTTNIVRFPGGSRTAGSLKNSIIKELRDRNYGWVDWTAQDGDGGNLSSVTEARNNFYGSINQNIEVVLFHDYNKITTSLLQEFIDYLHKENYILLPLFYESNMVNK